MKKNILIIGIVIASLALVAFTLMSNSDTETEQAMTETSAVVEYDRLYELKDGIAGNPDFHYMVGTRFNPITKTKLQNATAFRDFIGDEHANKIVSYQTLNVILLDDNQKPDQRVDGESGDLTAAQIEFLQAANYSTDLVIWADYIYKSPGTGTMIEETWTPYLTVVPEKQAKYIHGEDAFINYFKQNSIAETAMAKRDELKPGKLYFTVNAEGVITDATIKSSSGYPAIDEWMIELISKVPGKWIPAENAAGEKVAQELVVSFGNIGC